MGGGPLTSLKAAVRLVGGQARTCFCEVRPASHNAPRAFTGNVLDKAMASDPLSLEAKRHSSDYANFSLVIGSLLGLG
jgi:hypothetical protein